MRNYVLYSIHTNTDSMGMEYEHFGMVVAEMRTAGMLPFAHDSGGTG